MNGYSIKIHKCWSLRGNLDAVIVVVTDIEINSVLGGSNLFLWIFIQLGSFGAWHISNWNRKEMLDLHPASEKQTEHNGACSG